MRYLSKTAGADPLAAGLFFAPAVSALSLQAPPDKSDGSSNLADPDEPVERMADQQRPTNGRGRLRAFSDNSVDARDAVRSQASDSRVFRPFR